NGEYDHKRYIVHFFSPGYFQQLVLLHDCSKTNYADTRRFFSL
ncbi:MAG: hypothetical protein ACI9MF_002749, partial [Gammaproteobacteria bacterium]